MSKERDSIKWAVQQGPFERGTAKERERILAIIDKHIGAKFKSGNSIPVRDARIKSCEYENLISAIREGVE